MWFITQNLTIVASTSYGLVSQTKICSQKTSLLRLLQAPFQALKATPSTLCSWGQGLFLQTFPFTVTLCHCKGKLHVCLLLFGLLLGPRYPHPASEWTSTPPGLPGQDTHMRVEGWHSSGDVIQDDMGVHHLLPLRPSAQPRSLSGRRSPRLREENKKPIQNCALLSRRLVPEQVRGLRLFYPAV